MNIFPKNARVCFLGSSGTHNNGYVMHVTAYYKKYFPELNVNFFNCGVSGATLKEQLQIVKQDTLSYNPTHVVILMGMNDTERDTLVEKRSKERYEKLKLAFENFKNNLDKICDILRENNVEIVLCTITPYDEYGDYCTAPLKGAFALAMAYNEYIRGYAKLNGYPLCDYFPYILEKMQSERIYCEDSVHFLDEGQYYVAKCFLENQGIEVKEKLDFSPKMIEWNEKVQIIRNIYAVEMMVLKDFAMPYSEGSKIVEKFMNSNDCNEWFYGICDCYLKNKPNVESIKQNMINIMENELE